MRDTLRSGTCWEPHCDACGQGRGGDESVFSDTCPNTQPRACWRCLAPPELQRWTRSELRGVYVGPLVKPHFTPHMNVCLGRYVESREHFEHLKEKTGTTEVVLKRRKRGSLPAIAEAAHSRQTAEVRGVSIPDPETIPKEVLEEDEWFEEHTVIEEDADA